MLGRYEKYHSGQISSRPVPAGCSHPKINGGFSKGNSPENDLNSGLGIIVILPRYYGNLGDDAGFLNHPLSEGLDFLEGDGIGTGGVALIWHEHILSYSEMFDSDYRIRTSTGDLK